MMSPESERELIRRLRNGSIKLDHEGDIWHDDEKFNVKFMFEEGYGISQIAMEVQRTEHAVMQQIEKMDLYQRALNPKRRKRSAKVPVCLCKVCTLDVGCCPRGEGDDATQEVG